MFFPIHLHAFYCFEQPEYTLLQCEHSSNCIHQVFQCQYHKLSLSQNYSQIIKMSSTSTCVTCEKTLSNQAKFSKKQLKKHFTQRRCVDCCVVAHIKPNDVTGIYHLPSYNNWQDERSYQTRPWTLREWDMSFTLPVTTYVRYLQVRMHTFREFELHAVRFSFSPLQLTITLQYLQFQHEIDIPRIEFSQYQRNLPDETNTVSFVVDCSRILFSSFFDILTEKNANIDPKETVVLFGVFSECTRLLMGQQFRLFVINYQTQQQSHHLCQINDLCLQYDRVSN
jgi:hypothetical protein